MANRFFLNIMLVLMMLSAIGHGWMPSHDFVTVDSSGVHEYGKTDAFMRTDVKTSFSEAKQFERLYWIPALSSPRWHARLKHMARRNNIRSVLDVGAGLGNICNALLSWLPYGGGEGVAMEAEPMPRIYNEKHRCKQALVDLNKDSLYVDRRYDVVVSLEVIEHISRDKHCSLIDFIAASARKFVITSIASMMQGGDGHIACRNHHDFTAEWTRRGFKLDRNLSMELRTAAREKHLKTNLFVFQVPDPLYEARPLACLAELLYGEYAHYSDLERMLICHRTATLGTQCTSGARIDFALPVADLLD